MALQQQHAAAGPTGRRSAAPPVQAPPSLYADPLQLSPLHELPFLFVLQHRVNTQLNTQPVRSVVPGFGVTAAAGHVGMGGGLKASHIPGLGETAADRSRDALGQLTGRAERNEEAVRRGLAAGVGGGVGARGGATAGGMRHAYMTAYLSNADPGEDLLGGCKGGAGRGKREDGMVYLCVRGEWGRGWGGAGGGEGPAEGMAPRRA